MKKLLVIILVGFSIFSPCKAQSWSAMDTGIMIEPPIAYEPGVDALQIYNNALFAGGYNFEKAGSIFLPGEVVEWNGTVWDSISRGTYSPTNLTVLHVYNGNLIAGGVLSSNLSQWNGSNWSYIGTGPTFFYGIIRLPGEVWALTEYNGNLVAGGRFDSITGMYANDIAYWNGTAWNTFSLGLTNPSSGGINTLTVYNGNLIAGGYFDSAGGQPVQNIAMWNGSSWLPLGAGINAGVNTLEVYNGNLIAGGEFDSAGGVPARNIAMWNGTNWASIGTVTDTAQGGIINTLLANNGYLYAGGGFDSIGGVPANSIAYWDGSNWHSIGKGITDGGVFTIAANGGIIYVGGSFDTAGGVYALNVAMCSNPTGIDEINNSTIFNVYPNPSNGLFTFQSSIKSDESVIDVYNMLGEKIYSEMLKQVQHDYNLDLKTQPNGVYLYRITTQNGNLLGEGKLVIQK